ncbi:MAG: hypothetical protein ACREKL_12280 [Chthoniobacterales bacterium]
MSEPPFFIFLFFGVGVVLVITIAILSWRRERERRDALAALAARLGFSFSASPSSGLATRFQEFRGMNTGDNRYAFNIMEGAYQGHQVMAFDFHYETSSTDSKGNRSTSHHYFHVVTLSLEREFPTLFVAPENIFSKIAQAFGYDDIDFESHEFSRRFCVRSKDRKFAYDFCNASMIEFLLAHPSLQLESRDGILAIVFNPSMDPQRIESELELACAVRGHMPDYLFEAA